MNEPNDPQLCLAIAKLLPLQLQVGEPNEQIYWLSNSGHPVQSIRDTEWLGVIRMIEQTLDAGYEESPMAQYQETLWYEANPGTVFHRDNFDVAYMANFISATFNQRARAMCAVKGITP